MRKIVLFTASMALVFGSCVSNPDGEKAETTDSVELTEQVAGEVYTINADDSELGWLGSKVTGQHHGVINFISGELVVEEKQLLGGHFVIDMNSIENQDLEGEYKEQLENHLKSDDFFAVETYPEATFEITGTEATDNEFEVVISGNLTLRGVTKNIKFNSQIEELTDEKIVAKADFNIAREDWGVNYEGKADDLISKEINIKVHLVAQK